MERNVGNLDRIVRIVVGVLAAVAGVVAVAGYWQAGAVVGGVTLLVGAILLATGTIRRCPIYAGTGIDTVEDRQ